MSLKRRLRKAVSKVVKPIMKVADWTPFTGFGALDPQGSGPLSGTSKGALQKLGLMSIPGDPNAGQLAATQAQLDALAAGELEKYQKGEITPGQEATIGKEAGVMTAQMKNALAQMGIADSSMAAVEKGNIEAYKAGRRETFVDQHWDNYIAASGQKNTALDLATSLKFTETAQNTQAYAGLMAAIGGVIGSWDFSDTMSTEAKPTVGVDATSLTADVG